MGNGQTNVKKFKKIEINEKNSSQLTEAIKTAEGKATARTVTPQMMIDKIKSVERRLQYPSKKTMHGLKILATSNEKLPNAYKYTAQGTDYTAENIRGKWYLTDVYRAAVRITHIDTYITATDEQKAAIMDKLLKY